jgi:chemotaxis protein MotA
LSTSEVLLKGLPEPGRSSVHDSSGPRRLDVWMLAGIVIALGATVAGIASTGVSFGYFFQPTGALIVLGGTIGVVFITTPGAALRHSVRRVLDLFWAPSVSREDLIEEIVSYVRVVRKKGLLAIEPLIGKATNKFLGETLLLALDVSQRTELQTALENKVRLRERQGEADAKILEVAGGFAPTIGVMGTVVGLIDVLRQFSSTSLIAYGIGTAFVSTIYGLGLANLVLLPAASRIRARVAEVFEIEELMVEGTLCLFDRIHPSLVRQRLSCYVRDAGGQERRPLNTVHDRAAG